MNGNACHFGDGSVRISVPYNKRWVEDLKSEVPFKYREWDPDYRVWTVQSPYAFQAESLTRRYFPNLEILGRAKQRGDQSAHRPFESANRHQTDPQPTPLRPEANALATLHLLPSAPPSVVEAVYRVLSKEAHPDRGGSDDVQRELNAAIDVLRKRVAS